MHTSLMLLLSPPLKILYNLPLFQPSPHSKLCNNALEGSTVEFTMLPGLIKGISRALEHSGKCGRVTERVPIKCDMCAEVFPGNLIICSFFTKILYCLHYPYFSSCKILIHSTPFPILTISTSAVKVSYSKCCTISVPNDFRRPE
ncbi:hypothetical protein ACTXT7_013786 [Hymenolepis weldensis]